MTDSFVSYKHFNSNLDMNTISHYHIHKSIMQAYILSGSTDVTTPIYQTLSNESSLSSNNSTSISSVKRRRLNDINLHLLTGNLQMRLDYTTSKYWPSACKKKEDYCQLHYWAFKGSMENSWVYKNLIYCDKCRVTLCCGYYYEVFYTI